MTNFRYAPAVYIYSQIWGATRYGESHTLLAAVSEIQPYCLRSRKDLEQTSHHPMLQITGSEDIYLSKHTEPI